MPPEEHEPLEEGVVEVGPQLDEEQVRSVEQPRHQHHVHIRAVSPLVTDVLYLVQPGLYQQPVRHGLDVQGVQEGVVAFEDGGYQFREVALCPGVQLVLLLVEEEGLGEALGDDVQALAGELLVGQFAELDHCLGLFEKHNYGQSRQKECGCTRCVYRFITPSMRRVSLVIWLNSPSSTSSFSIWGPILVSLRLRVENSYFLRRCLYFSTQFLSSRMEKQISGTESTRFTWSSCYIWFISPSNSVARRFGGCLFRRFMNLQCIICRVSCSSVFRMTFSSPRDTSSSLSSGYSAHMRVSSQLTLRSFMKASLSMPYLCSHLLRQSTSCGEGSFLVVITGCEGRGQMLFWSESKLLRDIVDFLELNRRICPSMGDLGVIDYLEALLINV